MLVSNVEISAYTHFPIGLKVLLCIKGRISRCRIKGKVKVKVKVKVKCTLVQALRLCTGRTAHRRSRGIALLFLDQGTRRDEGSALRPGRSLPPGKTRYPLYKIFLGGKERPGCDADPSPPSSAVAKKE